MRFFLGRKREVKSAMGLASWQGESAVRAPGRRGGLTAGVTEPLRPAHHLACPPVTLL